MKLTITQQIIEVLTEHHELPREEIYRLINQSYNRQRTAVFGQLRHLVDRGVLTQKGTAPRGTYQFSGKLEEFGVSPRLRLFNQCLQQVRVNL